MASLQVYDQLLQFPLFLGMSRDELTDIVGHTKFEFLKDSAHHTIIASGSACTHLYFLLSGTVSVETRSDDGSYVLTEQLSSPAILQPEAVFGYQQSYTHSFTSLSSVAILRIERSEIVRLTQDFLIFRINLLNLLATHTQKLLHRPWRRAPQSLRERIARFISDHCVYPAGAKTLRIHMTQLATEVGDSRLDVSRALNSLQDDGLIRLRRGIIEVPQLECIIHNA